MKPFFSTKIFLVMAVLIAVVFIFTFSSRHSTIDYNTQVKPIFNKKCIMCHGGVRQKSGFSLLFRSDALAKNESGKRAIIPGKPEESELIRRVSLKDPEERMPYRHEPLSEEEISILRNWIKQGAVWGDHWAYVAVKPVKVPDIQNDWVKNDIDKFIYDKLQGKKWKPSPQADKSTLLRRVSLDLIGMLPPSNLAQQYLQNSDNRAYEVLVDSLLASPHYGERWTSMWLDIARYSDTKGYEKDEGRNIWQYRDWVIRAFNADKPYDKFLTEQIAGDLLPNPSEAQYIATAFHRNTMNNDEGGTDNEEFRTASVIDRVNTTWEALMGTSFGCVQCHSHPYDPFRHDEYYKFMAFFNNTRDVDEPEEYPVLRQFSDSLEQQLQALTTWVEKHSSDSMAKAIDLFLRTWQPSIHSTLIDNITNNLLENNNYALLFRNHAMAILQKVDLQNSDEVIFRYSSWKDGGVLKIHRDSANGPVLASRNLKLTKGMEFVSIDIPTQSGMHDIYFQYDNPSGKNPEEHVILFDWFSFMRQFPGKGAAGYEANKKLYWKLLTANLPGTPIMMENSLNWQRKTHVFERGNWLVKGKEVEADVPNSLRYAMPANAPKNRMGLAMWLTSKQNPLVARTLVNRFWEQLFGAGIAETLEDLGTQGIAPTHKELMDYLSWKLMNDLNWSMKKLLKEMVMSATYRQDSKLTEDLKQKDLFNKYYARGPRVRLSAEQLRDQDLCISGMLSNKMYGSSVMPWQPEGIWLSPYNNMKWVSSSGENQFRRALYTFWKRSSPYPSMIAFDGTQRVVCNSRRIRTNTPLQALVTLNDSVYLELSRYFAYRMQREAGSNVKDQIAKGYEFMLYKPIPPGKLNIFMDLYNDALAEFNKDPDKTCKMVGIMNEHNNPPSAALVVVANAMLNLDEVITKN